MMENLRAIRLPMGVGRDSLAKRICREIECVKPIRVKDITRYVHHDESWRNGLYVIYDKKNVVLYVGKVGGSASASVYMRIKAHLRNWNVLSKPLVSFRFRKFESFTPEHLKIAERLAIARLRPVLNDGGTSQDKVDRYEWVL